MQSFDNHPNPEYQKILEEMKRKLAGLREQYEVPALDTTKVEPVLRAPSYPSNN